MVERTISDECFSALYVRAIEHVLEHGSPVVPRGLRTIEVRGCVLRLGRPCTRVLDVPGRVTNPAFAVAEAVWILSGSDAPWIFTYNEQLRRYADNGVLRGAYGPRIRRWHGEIDQLARVRRLLARDPDSRQAVVQIFDPVRDWAGAQDVPCTLGHRFFLRDGVLHQHCTMRSQDAWLGLPYDVFSNTVLQEVMAGWLGVAVGEYVHSVDSLHIYEHDIEAANAILAAGSPGGPAAADADVDLSVDAAALDRVLEATLAGPSPELPDGWRSYAAALASYRCWKEGGHADAMTYTDMVRGPLRGALQRWYAHLESAESRHRSDTDG